MTRNEDFLFAQEAIAQGFVSEAQVEEAMLLQRRMADDLKLDERLGVILVKRGYLAEDQARRVYARIEPEKTGEIRGYRLLDVIGRGAMGTVYRALHLGLNRVVALKILRPDLRGDRTQIERLKAEAAMLASLDHPNVVRVLDAGESNGYPYFVMEYVEGETLRDRLRRDGPLPEAEALRITRAIADALERARRMGIVHRDVKPGNVLLSRNGTPKLMDMGLAKGPIDLGLTQHGATVGTPQYISPEQAVDPKKADTRSDIYGLGATLYAMLTGEPPFDGETLAEILTKVLYESPVPVRTRRPGVSREVGYLVERMMLKDPTLRYKVPAAVVVDIDRIEQGASILPAGFTGNWEGWLLRARTKRLLLFGGATVAAAVLLAFGVRFVLSWMGESQAREALERQVERALLETAIAPTDSRQDLWEKLQRIQGLVAQAKEHALADRTDLDRRLADLDQEVERYDRLTETIRRQVAGYVAVGEFGKAETELLDVIHGLAGYGPAERRAQEELDRVREASDAVLRRARETEFERPPGSFDALARRLQSWSERVATGFADTSLAKAEAKASRDANLAARALRTEMDDASQVVASPDLQGRVERLDFARLLADVEDPRSRAQIELARRLSDLQPYYGAEVLRSLAAAPFDQAVADLAAAVERKWAALAASADALASPKERRVVDAIALVRAFEAAARDSFPDSARRAADKAATLERTSAAQFALAEGAWERLLARVRDAIRQGDAAAVRARVAEAKAAPEAYWPVMERVERLEESAVLLEEFWERVASGVEAHVGPAKDRWLETVTLRDGTKDHKWEVRSVDRARRTVTIVSHKGNVDRPAEVKWLAGLSDDMLASLAGLRAGVARDAALRGMHLLSTQQDDASDLLDATDPNARLQHYRRVLELLDQGDQGGRPIARWIADRMEQLEGRARGLEALAEDTLKTARAAYAAGKNVDAYHRFLDLERTPLSHTKASRTNRAEVTRNLERIRKEMDAEVLSLLLPDAKVRQLHGDAVEVTFDFDTPTQEKNFREGSALFVRAPSAVPLTPGKAENWRLRLLPARDGGVLPEGTVVPDRPLAMQSPLDPTKERSVSFQLWVYSPFFLGLDLDGVQAAVLSADPARFPFPHDVPKYDEERRPPPLDFYGRGRGVVFKRGTGLAKPWEWSVWEKGHQGREFVPPDRDKPARKEQMDERWFAFEPQDRPYKVRFVHNPEGTGRTIDKGTVRLEVDGRQVLQDESADWRRVVPSGLIQLLTFTTCDVDDLVLTGKISETWRREAEARKGITRP